jgi:hypothetical protein
MFYHRPWQEKAEETHDGGILKRNQLWNLFLGDDLVSRLGNKFDKLRSSGRAEVSPLFYNAVITKP